MQRVRNLIPVPVWASLLANVGWFCMTMPRYTFTYVTHSHLLGGIATFGSRLPPFLPCTPTFDNQSLAVGRCWLSTSVTVRAPPVGVLMSVPISHTSLLKESTPEFLRDAEFCVTHHKKLESPEENEHSILGYPAAALLFCIADTIGSYHHGKRNFTVPLDGKQ